MWNRKEVKAKGLKAFKANSWKCIAALILVGAIAGGTGAYRGYNAPTINRNYAYTSNEVGEFSRDIASLEEDFEDMTDVIDNEGITSLEEDFEDMTDIIDNEGITTLEVDLEDMTNEPDVPVAFIIGIGVFLSIVIALAVAIGIVFEALVLNPVKLGSSRFFRRNLEEPASLDNLMFAFRNHYKNVTKTMFMRDLYIFLWSLLFVIPGIIKAYEYRMVEYILSENPEMNYNDALALSSKMMKGNKWNTFVLDLSFIGWDILSSMTFGILGIFYVEPYKKSTDAALYEAIKYGTAA